MISAEPGMRSYEITVIIQHDALVVDAFDFSKGLQCNWFRHLRKTVTHSPIPVLSLSESRVAYPGAPIDVWMNVQKGTQIVESNATQIKLNANYLWKLTGDSPFAPILAGNVPIGEKLTVSLYLNDPSGRFDLQVRRCHAYDAQNFTSESTQRLALTDRHGCSARPQLLSSFLKLRRLQSRPELLQRMTSPRDRTANVLVYGVINAFRFPERSDVYVSCSVEVCSGDCDNSCQPEVNNPDDANPIVRPQRPHRPHQHHSKRKQQQQINIKIPSTIHSNETSFTVDDDAEPEVITNSISMMSSDSNETEIPVTSGLQLNVTDNRKRLQRLTLDASKKGKFKVTQI
jgi:hypothetical protein